ncbi:hypothetical protein ZHAS_00016993 [Anopheles sinensis]|uniref:Uncharacterized protein n=1 Tax=Anopheles sinensis TaxID=74873 RepID=A0A084WFJ4_ANOSI|nr:hypothetical protein ZHAS_00016993 [Anopheles sinensis]
MVRLQNSLRAQNGLVLLRSTWFWVDWRTADHVRRRIRDTMLISYRFRSIVRRHNGHGHARTLLLLLLSPVTLRSERTVDLPPPVGSTGILHFPAQVPHFGKCAIEIPFPLYARRRRRHHRAVFKARQRRCQTSRIAIARGLSLRPKAKVVPFDPNRLRCRCAAFSVSVDGSGSRAAVCVAPAFAPARACVCVCARAESKQVSRKLRVCARALAVDVLSLAGPPLPLNNPHGQGTAPSPTPAGAVRFDIGTALLEALTWRTGLVDVCFAVRKFQCHARSTASIQGCPRQNSNPTKNNTATMRYAKHILPTSWLFRPSKLVTHAEYDAPFYFVCAGGTEDDTAVSPKCSEI